MYQLFKVLADQEDLCVRMAERSQETIKTVTKLMGQASAQYRYKQITSSEFHGRYESLRQILRFLSTLEQMYVNQQTTVQKLRGLINHEVNQEQAKEETAAGEPSVV